MNSMLPRPNDVCLHDFRSRQLAWLWQRHKLGEQMDARAAQHSQHGRPCCMPRPVLSCRPGELSFHAASCHCAVGGYLGHERTCLEPCKLWRGLAKING